MSTLLICLDGPMQAWGTSSRFTNRAAGTEPSKSGIIGLLAAAQGVRRSESIEHLLGLRFGVRVDREGRLMRDFQVARTLDGKKTMPVSHRFYLADAVFVAAVEGESDLIESLASALSEPAFPLYLGRRSCPPSRPVFMESSPLSLREALRAAEWQVSANYRRYQSKTVILRAVEDGAPGMGDTVRDVPISFDPRRREYGWRSVEEFTVTIENSEGGHTHDPLAIVGGG